MAQVASIYTELTHYRSAESIIKCDENNVRTIRASVKNKRVWARAEQEQSKRLNRSFLIVLNKRYNVNHIKSDSRLLSLMDNHFKEEWQNRSVIERQRNDSVRPYSCTWVPMESH